MGTKNTLSCAEPCIDLGICLFDREEPRIKCEFDVVVTGEEVSVTEIERTCSCIAANEKELVGHRFEHGATFSVKLAINVRSQVGKILEFAILQTNPKSTEPLLLSIRAFIQQKPKLSPVPLILKTTAGHKAEGIMVASYSRDKSLKQLQFVPEKSQTEGFNVEFIERQLTTKARVGGQVTEGAIDVLNFRVAQTELSPIGMHEHELILDWGDSLPQSRLPILVEVIHPFIIDIGNRLFLGNVKSKDQIERRVKISRQPGWAWDRLSELRAEPNFISGLVAKESDELIVKVRVPRERGRFEGKVVLNFEKDSQLPPVVFTVSGIVQNK